MRRIHLASDLFRHFKSELKALRREREQARPELRRRELVEGEIAADRRKGLGVLAQAGGFENLARKTAAREVIGARIHLPDPAFVFPGAATYVDSLGGQAVQARRQRIPIEAGGFVKQRVQG